MTNLRDIPLSLNDGTSTTLNALAAGELILLVNTASQCGLTPQYKGLQQLQETYGARGFTVVGAPCNQFNEQEPGSDEEIAQFCSRDYGVSFPLLSKLEVNGSNAHPLYQELTQVEDDINEAGDVAWNFEKFFIASNGNVVARIRPRVEPDAFELIKVLEANLPK